MHYSPCLYQLYKNISHEKAQGMSKISKLDIK